MSKCYYYVQKKKTFKECVDYVLKSKLFTQMVFKSTPQTEDMRGYKNCKQLNGTGL